MRPAVPPLFFALLACLTLHLPPARCAEEPATPPNSAPSPAPLNEAERLRRIAAEVQRRREIREAALANARRLVAEHETGKTPATPAALADAQKLIRDAEAARLRTKQPSLDQSAKPTKPPAPDERVTLRLADADMVTVATTWKLYFNEYVKISDRVQHRVVSATLDESFGVMRQKLEAVLLRHGIVVIDGPDGKRFDAAPVAPPAARTP